MLHLEVRTGTARLLKVITGNMCKKGLTQTADGRRGVHWPGN